VAEPSAWNVEQGATFTIVYEWRDGGEDGPLIPFASVGLVRSQIRRRQSPGAELIHTLTAGELLPDTPEAGFLTVRIGADVTAGFTRGGWFDVEVYDPGDPTQVIRFAEGPVTLDPEVTTVAS